MMEGQNEILLWAHVFKDFNLLVSPFLNPSMSSQELLTTITESINRIFSLFPYKQEVFDEVQRSLAKLSNPTITTEAEILADARSVLGETAKVMIQGFD